MKYKIEEINVISPRKDFQLIGMGCHQSTPVPRIKQDPKEPADSDQTTNDSFHELSDNFNLTGRSQGTPRTACSFGFLIEQTENYQIYEYICLLYTSPSPRD